MVPCDISVQANIVGILLEVLGLLIVIQHDWRREQERRRARRTLRATYVEAGVVTVTASATATDVLTTNETSSGHKVVERTEQDRRLDDLERKYEEVLSQLSGMRSALAQVGVYEMQIDRLEGQQSEIRETFEQQQQEAARREGWRFTTSLLAGAFVIAGPSMQIGVSTCA